MSDNPTSGDVSATGDIQARDIITGIQQNFTLSSRSPSSRLLTWRRCGRITWPTCAIATSIWTSRALCRCSEWHRQSPWQRCTCP
jgi:hypothetical protein